MDKLTIRDFDAAGQARLRPRRLQRPARGRQGHRRLPDPGRPADDHDACSTAGRGSILASHLGRPDGKVQDGLRLRPVGAAPRASSCGRNVPVTGDALGVGTEDAVKRMRPGEALLLENLRFHAEEEKNDPAFAQALASYADVYVNDAFGTAHRAHASTVGIAQLLPAYAGLLMEREIEMLVQPPREPGAAVRGDPRRGQGLATRSASSSTS